MLGLQKVLLHCIEAPFHALRLESLVRRIAYLSAAVHYLWPELSLFFLSSLFSSGHVIGPQPLCHKSSIDVRKFREAQPTLGLNPTGIYPDHLERRYIGCTDGNLSMSVSKTLLTNKALLDQTAGQCTHSLQRFRPSYTRLKFSPSDTRQKYKVRYLDHYNLVISYNVSF
jgi:hypothetical protein